MRVKVYITLEVDEEDYPIPSDGMVGDEIEEGLREYLTYDIDGIEIKTIKTITE